MFFGVNVFISNVIGYIVGLISSFLFNRNWVFIDARTNKVSGQLLRFIYSFITAYSINILVLYVLISSLINPYLSQAFASCFYLVVFYCLNKYHVFKKNI